MGVCGLAVVAVSTDADRRLRRARAASRRFHRAAVDPLRITRIDLASASRCIPLLRQFTRRKPDGSFRFPPIEFVAVSRSVIQHGLHRW
jgi:hypothetical protein